jgi:hypothetical protein
MTADGDTEYRVGRGRPPLETRFQKGNPGRPRGARRLSTRLIEALERRVAVTNEDGKSRRVAKSELGIARFADKFAAGDPQALKLFLGLLLELERRPPPEPAERPPFEEADRMVIANLLARLRASN